ncbi:MAG: tyrosine-type recombinase/integrase [Hyphomicrobiaceae bacterium]
MLTDSILRNAISRAKAERRTIAVRDTGKTSCLEFRASYGGKASFAYVYRPADAPSPRRLKLGTYGPGFGLADARTAAQILIGKRAGGIDPLNERASTERQKKAQEAETRRRETAERNRLTFAGMAELYFSGHKTRHRSYFEMYSLNVQPLIGPVAVVDITRDMVQQIVDAVVSRGAHVQARRAFEVTRAMLRWGRGRNYLQGEPWKGVDLPEKGVPRTRVLSAAELRWVWQAGGIAWANKPNLLRMVRLQILLGLRSSEIAGLERGELSDDLLFWTIPGIRTKNKQRHVVPLPPMARAIIREALAQSNSKTHVFVGGRGKVERNDHIAHAVADLLADHNETVSEDNWIPRMTPHDFRRTLATGLESLGVPTNVIAAALNHISVKSSSVTTKHYAHADLTLEVRTALTRWQATIEAILAGGNPLALCNEDVEALEARILASTSVSRHALARLG